MAIVVRFIAQSDLVSAGIRKVTGSLFSHVEFGTPEGTWIGAHWADGIQERPANYCQTTLDYRYEIPCTDLALADHLLTIRKAIGTVYNKKDILGLMFQSRTLTGAQGAICSQFCCGELLRVYGAAKVLNVLPNWTYRITPEILHLSPIFVGRRTASLPGTP